MNMIDFFRRLWRLPVPRNPVPLLARRCAWCQSWLSECGTPLAQAPVGPDVRETHGICVPCRDKVLAEDEARTTGVAQ